MGSWKLFYVWLLDILKLGKRFEDALGFHDFLEVGVFGGQFFIVFGRYLAQFFVNVLGDGQNLVAVSLHLRQCLIIQHDGFCEEGGDESLSSNSHQATERRVELVPDRLVGKEVLGIRRSADRRQVDVVGDLMEANGEVDRWRHVLKGVNDAALGRFGARPVADFTETGSLRLSPPFRYFSRVLFLPLFTNVVKGVEACFEGD